MKHDSYVIGYVRDKPFLDFIKVDGIRYNLEPNARNKDIAVMHRNDLSFLMQLLIKRFSSYSLVIIIYRKSKSNIHLFANEMNTNGLPKNKVCGLDLYDDIRYAKQFGTFGAVAEMLIIVRKDNQISFLIDFKGDGIPDNIDIKIDSYDLNKDKGIDLDVSIIS